ncbi:E3 ubiquitin-protein ligase MIB2-like [Littorina saxatilis]|uniref:E3 ubiquitin-protein ligase MIB2-like n=1 Tax=Littorina saxatilis TaxID=31220 RepID=UPI0038B6A7EB
MHTITQEMTLQIQIEGEVQEMTPLIYASLRGQRQCMLTLLQMGADVNRHATSDFRKTPMSAAIEGKEPSVVEVLLQHGASTSYVFTFGHTAAHYAVIKDAPVALRPLAEYGANMNAKDDFGDTPLHMAIERQQHACMEVLVDLPQVDVLALNKHSMNMIHLACMMDNPTALAKVLSHDRSGVEALRKHSPALHMAAARDNVDCVRLMVMDGGADINSREEGKRLTALHVACHAAKLQTVEALLEMVSVHTNSAYHF